MPSSEMTRVGVIGAGSIGPVHIEAYKKVSTAKIAAVCDIDLARAETAAGKYEIPKTYEKYADLLADPEIDAVSVCVPNYLHAEIAVAALKAGKHVLCEKPMADTLAHAEEIAEAADEAAARGQKLMIGMNNRFNGDTQALKKAIDAGRLGEIYYAKCGWIRRKGIPGFGGWFTTKAKSGGGPLIDIGVHALDLCLYLMGNPTPVAVSGSTYAKFGPQGKGAGNWGSDSGSVSAVTYDVEDLAAGLVKMSNGATLILEASWASHIRSDHGPYATLIGDLGGAEIGASGGPGAVTAGLPATIFTDLDGQTVNVELKSNHIGGHDAEVRHFVDCVRSGDTPISTARQGLHVLQILDALYRSAAAGREIVIG